MSAPPPAQPGSSPWQRLHPLTPLLRGGRFFALLVALFTQQGLRVVPSARVVLAVVLGGTALALAGGALTWRTTRYRLQGGELQVDSGILRRRSRRVPLARPQSVELVRPLVGRVLGLAELRLEVAGGSHPEAPLAYLSEPVAARLRRQLLAYAEGTSSAAQEPQQERVLVTVPTATLVASILLGPPALLCAALVAGVVLTAVLDLEVGLGTALAGLPVLLGAGGVAVRRALAEYGFTVAESGDGLRLRHGLLDTRSSSIPAGRVQAMRVREPLLWRRPGWVRVEVDVAGYGRRSREEHAANPALLPVAPRAFAFALVDRVLDPRGDRPLPAADRPVPRSARWRAPLAVRRLRVGLDDRHLVCTSGVLTTTTDVVPLAKVQSLRLTQGPWQRRLGLASVTAEVAGRHLHGATARHRGLAEARALLVELDTRARAARRAPPA